MTDIARIEAAEARIRPYLRTTPILTSPHLDAIAGRRVLVKAEALQHTGSFKYRGGRAAISALDDAARAAGVIAFSSGNHAQGVARAAREMGVPAVIVMPSDAPALKIANTRADGAEVVLYDRATEDRDAIGERIAAERGLTLVRPFDDPEVIAGQGTCGLEIAAQVDGAADVLVCCGGGGLSAGIALALADRAPDLRVRTVEPEGFDDVARSLVSGGVEANRPGARTVCDAIMTPNSGRLTLPVLRDRAGPGIAVTDDEVLAAMAQAFLRLKLVVEPGGAAALAAALYHPDEIEGDSVVAVATGGNVDPAVFARALATLG